MKHSLVIFSCCTAALGANVSAVHDDSGSSGMNINEGTQIQDSDLYSTFVIQSRSAANDGQGPSDRYGHGRQSLLRGGYRARGGGHERQTAGQPIQVNQNHPGGHIPGRGGLPNSRDSGQRSGRDRARAIHIGHQASSSIDRSNGQNSRQEEEPRDDGSNAHLTINGPANYKIERKTYGARQTGFVPYNQETNIKIAGPGRVLPYISHAGKGKHHAIAQGAYVKATAESHGGTVVMEGRGPAGMKRKVVNEPGQKASLQISKHDDPGGNANNPLTAILETKGEGKAKTLIYAGGKPVQKGVNLDWRDDPWVKPKTEKDP